MSDHPKMSVTQSRLFIKNLAANNPFLLKAIIRFNYSLNRSRENEFIPQTSLIASSNRAKAKLNGAFTKGYWDFEEESSRITLLDTNTLKDLLLTWGAAFCAPVINRFVTRQDVDTLHKNIDQKYIEFAIGRGQFALGDLLDIVTPVSGKVPPEKIKALIRKYGMTAHEICLAAWPQALQKIQIQKIKQELPDWFKLRPSLSELHPSHPRAIWFSIKKILLKEVAPQWTPCFS